MTQDRHSTVWGGLLITVGLLVLFANWGFLGGLSRLLWSGLFFAGSVAFLLVFGRDQKQWWALIPASALLALGAVSSWGRLLGAWSGGMFLAIIGLGFAAVYLTGRERWWALIPAGVLITLAVVSGFPGAAAGSLLFLGIALTFGLVYLAPGPLAPNRWALYPALGALVMAGLNAGAFSRMFNLLTPLALIGVGVYLLQQRRKPLKEPEHEA